MPDASTGRAADGAGGASAAARARAGRRGVPRRRRLGVPGVGGPPTRSGPTRAPRSPPCRRRWPATSWPTAAALAAEWGLRWQRGRHRRAGRPRLRGQRRRPLLPLQDGAHGRARPDGRRGRRHRGARASTSTTSATTGPGQRAAAERGAVFPLVEAGFTKADVRSLVAGGSACARGTSRRRRAWRRACPTARRSPSAVLIAGRAGRGGAAARSGFADAAGAPLRRHGPPRGAARRPATCWCAQREAVVAAVRGAGLPLRHARPRGPALRATSTAHCPRTIRCRCLSPTPRSWRWPSRGRSLGGSSGRWRAS